MSSAVTAPGDAESAGFGEGEGVTGAGVDAGEADTSGTSVDGAPELEHAKRATINTMAATTFILYPCVGTPRCGDAAGAHGVSVAPLNPRSRGRWEALSRAVRQGRR